MRFKFNMLGICFRILSTINYACIYIGHHINRLEKVILNKRQDILDNIIYDKK